MQITLLGTLVLHVLSGVFWAGSTFALARTGGASAHQMLRPQMGAAVVALITGGPLCAPALRQLAREGEKDARSQGRVALGQQIAAALLALTVICMAAARYV